MRHGAFTQLVMVVLVSMPTLQTRARADVHRTGREGPARRKEHGAAGCFHRERRANRKGVGGRRRPLPPPLAPGPVAQRQSQPVTLPRVVFCAFRSDTDTGASFLPWKICEQLTRNPPPFSCRPGHTVIQLSRVFRPLATSTHCRCGRTRRDGLAGARYGPAPALPSEVSSKGVVGGVVGGALARFFFLKIKRCPGAATARSAQTAWR